MSPRTPDALRSNLVLGRYRIVARLAKGGMGVVYLARAEGAAGFVKPVVVKRILPSLHGDEKMTRLFIREAKILANLHHPGIVSVIDFGEEDDAYIMVLDYAPSYNLARWLRYLKGLEEKFPVDLALHIMIKVLDALEYAHKLALPDGTPLSIVHADISPSNILVGTDGQVQIVDFGIARMAGEQVTATNESGSIKGKFSYLPPEIFGGASADVRTDVYACGVVLRELLTGTNPFAAKEVSQVVTRVLNHALEPMSVVRPDAPPEVEAILARAIAKNPLERHASAGELARDLRRVRRMSDEEAGAALAAMARRDYLGPMPAKLGLAPLHELEEQWRHPPEGGLKDSLVPRAISAPPGGSEVNTATDPAERRPSRSDVPTQTAASSLVTAPVGARPRRALATIVTASSIAAVVAVVAVGAAWALTRRDDADDQGPRYIVVEHKPSSSSSPSAAPPPPDSAVATAPVLVAAEAGGAPSASARTPGKESAGVGAAPSAVGGADALSTAFAKSQPQIEACFRNDADQVQGAPEVSVRFAIDKDGRVQRAELSPEALSGVPLGQCILGVARQTRFPAQSSAITFRIPIRAQRLR